MEKFIIEIDYILTNADCIWVLWRDDNDAQEAMDYLNQLKNANIDYWNSQGQGNSGMRMFWAPYGDLNLENVWQAYYPNKRFYEKLKYENFFKILVFSPVSPEMFRV